LEVTGFVTQRSSETIAAVQTYARQ
jgi:hypothetical protein